MKYLKIRPEYECSPLWLKVDNELSENINLTETNFDIHLKNRLTKWANQFDLTLNQDYPPDSNFKTLQDEIDFENEGFLIWNELKKDHSNEFDEIVYYSVYFEKTFSDLENYQEEYKNKKTDRPH